MGVSNATVVVVGWPAGAGSVDDALAELYQEHSRWLLGLVEALVGDRATAEDVVQEAFVRLHRAWPRLRDHDRAAGYLRVTALNLARSGFRRKLIALRYRPPTAEDERAADDSVVLREQQREVIAALRALPRRQRECLVLRFYGELSEFEIATTLGISNNSVKTHTRRGLAAMESRLESGR
ncbi:MAG: hypothetical protein QOC92_448 [Acidimicrobiaceae bacterium]|jgi:RNA polymerase sigma-70 factor (sigma-E family)